MLDQATAQALDDVARELVEARDVDQILATIVEAVRLSIDEVDHAGVSVAHRDGTIETRAATGDLVRLLDQAQYDTGQGPCLDAMAPSTHQDLVVVDNIRQEQRWPAYTPRALQHGLRSQLGVRIYAETKTVGGLNLYSTTSDTISAESVPWPTFSPFTPRSRSDGCDARVTCCRRSRRASSSGKRPGS